MSSGDTVAVLGGTFDPIHQGHLKLALDLAERLDVAKVRLMPSFQPVHRDAPSVTTSQRREMLEIAVADNKQLMIDDRELKREGPSYTLLSLQELRVEMGESTPIYFILGTDAFSHFDQWHQWRELLTYSHLIVAGRPGQHATLSQQLQDFVAKHLHSDKSLPTTTSGNILFIDNVLLDISSTDIRKRIVEKQPYQHLLPEEIAQYIEQYSLYQ